MKYAIGDKVICVDDENQILRRNGEPPLNGVKKGVIYVIRGFAKTLRPKTWPPLLLEGITNQNSRLTQEEIGFRANRFINFNSIAGQLGYAISLLPPSGREELKEFILEKFQTK